MVAGSVLISCNAEKGLIKLCPSPSPLPHHLYVSLQELVLFTGMMKEVFAGHPSTQHLQIQYGMAELAARGSAKTPTSSRHFKMAASQVDCSEQLKEEAVKAGFVPSPPWLGKVEQLHMLTQLKHGRFEKFLSIRPY